MPLRLAKYGRPLTPMVAITPAAANTTEETLADHAAQVFAVIGEHEHEPPKEIAPTPITTPAEPSTVREQIANKAVTSANAEREQPVMADLVREQIALTANNAEAVAAVLAIMPAANKASVAASVRRARNANNDMKGGYA